MRREWRIPDAWAGATLGTLIAFVVYVVMGFMWKAHLRLAADGVSHELPWLWQVVSFPIVATYQLASGNRGNLPESVMVGNAVVWGAIASVVVLKVSKTLERTRNRSSDRSSEMK